MTLKTSENSEEISVIKVYKQDLPRFHAMQSKLEVLRKKKMKQQDVMHEVLDAMERVM